MVDPIRVLLFFFLGVLAYIALPIIAGGMSAPVRRRVGKFYGDLGVKCLHQMVLVQKIVGGYELKQIEVDQEKKLLKTTLKSPLLGDDKDVKFNDPDARVKRLWNKHLTVIHEEIPSGISPELIEWMYWFRVHDEEHGTQSEGEVKPYMTAENTMRVVEPAQMKSGVSSGTQPKTIKTVVQLTKERMRKYGEGLGMKQAARIIFGFIAGAGVVYGGLYIKNEVIGGGGSIDNPVGGGVIQITMDTVVTLL